MNGPVVLLCPGRGSYGRAELGTLARLVRAGPVADALAAAEEARAAEGLPSLRELDAASQFRPGLHLQGRNASELIYFATLAAAAQVTAEQRVAAVLGNSLGWYTALAVAGALSPLDGWRLVHTMARLQELAAGGQLLTTLLDEEWRPDPALAAATDAALAAVRARGDGHWVGASIRLGGHLVLAGTESGIAALREQLPRVRHGEREFPLQLAGHGPFHTPLCAEVAVRAAAELAELGWQRPRVALVDGRGAGFSPWSAGPREIFAYTAGPQVTQTFDFTAAVRTALREWNPQMLIDLGPGATLRAPAGHVLLAEGWRGVRSKRELFAGEWIRAVAA